LTISPASIKIKCANLNTLIPNSLKASLFSRSLRRRNVVFGLHHNLGVKCSNTDEGSKKWSKAASAVQILYWLTPRPLEASAGVHRRPTGVCSRFYEVIMGPNLILKTLNG
jgi:hypothetical protein